MKKKYFIVAVLILILFTGCYDRRELEDLAIVAGIGVDLADDGLILITAQVVNPSALGSKGKGGSGGEPVWIVESKGKTIFEALRRALHHSPNKLYFSHNEIIVIGEDLAKKGLFSVSDFLLRDEEPREDAFLMIAEGKASDIIRAKIKITSVPALAIAKMVRSSWASAQAPMSRLIDFANKEVSKAPGVVLGRVSKRDDKEAEIEYNGAAVLKKDKLADWLTESEARGYLWIKGEVKGGVIVVTNTKYGGDISFEPVREKTICRPKILQNGKLSMSIDISLLCRLAGLTNSTQIENPISWTEYSAVLEEAVKKEVRSALNKAQSLKLDFLDFGEIVMRNQPKIWQEIKPVWEEIFSTIPVTINVDVAFNGVGMVKRSR